MDTGLWTVFHCHGNRHEAECLLITIPILWNLNFASLHLTALGRYILFSQEKFPAVSVCSLDPYSSKNWENVCFLSCHLNMGALQNNNDEIAPLSTLSFALATANAACWIWVWFSWSWTQPHQSLCTSAPRRPILSTGNLQKVLMVHLTSALMPIYPCHSWKSLGNSYFCIANRSKGQSASACTPET